MSHADGRSCAPETLHSQVELASGQPKQGSPATELRQRPDRTFVRRFYNAELTFPDGAELEIWSFEDDVNRKSFPAPLTRAREGEVLHVELKSSKRVHTIHHHGIEPDPRNDGVGHTSFEVTGRYTYQYRPEVGEPGNPNRGSAGTYFYHCHVNTVLHVQMGMFGPMIYDPPQGRGMAFIDDPEGYDTRAETLLVPYATDERWHRLGHAAGLDGEDVGLDRFEPSRFYLLGGDLDGLGPSRNAVHAVREVLATPAGERPGLLRINNANYFPTLISFGGGLEAEVFSHDGRPFRNTSVVPSPPVSARTTKLAFGAAERYDMRLRPPAGAVRGDTFPLTVQWFHWVTGEVVGTQRTRVRVI